MSIESPKQRISFSKFLVELEDHSPNPGLEQGVEEGGDQDKSSEFEFMSGDHQAESSGRSPADELFYNGKILPLEPVSRMAMVKDLNNMLRRGRSAPPSPFFDHSSSVSPSTTKKSSSYPPRGRSSRRFKDFFGVGKKNPSSGQEPSLPPVPPVSNNNNNNNRQVNESSASKFFKNVLRFGRKEGNKSQAQGVVVVNEGRSRSSSSSSSSAALLSGGIGRKKRGSPAEMTWSAPATPLHPRAMGFAPVLNLPVHKLFSQQASRTIEVL